MENNEIQKILINTLFLQEVYVSKDGNHFTIIVIDKMFYGMSDVEKQQIVYKPLMEYIADNSIHSLSIKAYTPQEWVLFSK